MSEFLKIEPEKCYFVTFTVVDWLDIFLREEYANILIDSIRYCQKYKGLELVANDYFEAVTKYLINSYLQP